MQDGVLLLDGGWRTVFANDAIDRHLGTRPEALAQLYPPGLRDLARKAADSRELLVAEVEIGVPQRWLRTMATPAGSDGSVLLVVTDVTETRRLEEVRRDFVANASHELKTPIASMQAAAETLVGAQGDPEAVGRFAPLLQSEAIRLGRIVTDLLDLSKLESGSELSEYVQVETLTAEEVARAAPSAEATGLRITVETDRCPAVIGSARDLSLLVRNLIDNAVRYTREGGLVRVDVAPDSGQVVLRVSDTGVGIPSRDLERVFERFYRVDPARSRETGGTGLGLALVKHVAENHGGTVALQSELGQGTTVEVRLPAAAS